MKPVTAHRILRLAIHCTGWALLLNLAILIGLALLFVHFLLEFLPALVADFCLWSFPSLKSREAREFFLTFLMLLWQVFYLLQLRSCWLNLRHSRLNHRLTLRIMLFVAADGVVLMYYGYLMGDHALGAEWASSLPWKLFYLIVLAFAAAAELRLKKQQTQEA